MFDRGLNKKLFLPLARERERGKHVLTLNIMHVATHRWDEHLLSHNPSLDAMLSGIIRAFHDILTKDSLYKEYRTKKNHNLECQ